MQIYKCDRCGAIIEDLDRYRIAYGSTIIVEHRNPCPRCFDEFGEFMDDKEITSGRELKKMK